MIPHQSLIPLLTFRGHDVNNETVRCGNCTTKSFIKASFHRRIANGLGVPAFLAVARRSVQRFTAVSCVSQGIIIDHMCYYKKVQNGLLSHRDLTAKRREFPHSVWHPLIKCTSAPSWRLPSLPLLKVRCHHPFYSSQPIHFLASRSPPPVPHHQFSLSSFHRC